MDNFDVLLRGLNLTVTIIANCQYKSLIVE